MANANLARDHGWAHAAAARARAGDAKALRLAAYMLNSRTFKEAAWKARIPVRTAQRLRGRIV